MRKIIFLIQLFISFVCFSQTLEIEEYFYPYLKYSYIVTPKAENPSLITSYQLTNGGVLVKTTEQFQGAFTRKLNEERFNVTLSDDTLSILCDRNIYYNSITHQRRSSTKIFPMFVLPPDNKTANWTHTYNNDEYTCSAKTVHITYTIDGKATFSKAICIEKHIKSGDTNVIEWEYWVKRIGRIATYGKWGDEEKTIQELLCTFKIKDISEISEEEYILKTK